jgi:Mor family transcriptional regulator
MPVRTTSASIVLYGSLRCRNSFCIDSTLRIHGIYDRFCESGESPELMKKYGLDAEGIANVVREEVKKNKK